MVTMKRTEWLHREIEIGALTGHDDGLEVWEEKKGGTRDGCLVSSFHDCMMVLTFYEHRQVSPSM